MGFEAFSFSEGHDDRAKFLQTCLCKFLRGDVLLERKGVDAAELFGITVCWEGVVGTRGVVSTAAKEKEKISQCYVKLHGKIKHESLLTSLGRRLQQTQTQRC